MKPVILFRKNYNTEDEFAAAIKYFPVYEYRSDIPANSLVISRYSALPFYHDLEYDLAHYQSKLLNSYKQHKWIANFEYYDVLRQYTPESWRMSEIPYISYTGPFVLKGVTNSKKYKWKSLMFAKDKIDANIIACKLMDDSLIGTQEIIYRKYVPLKTFDVGINGLPFSNEWRFFFLKDKLLTYGYYWSSAGELEIEPKISEAAIDLAKEIAAIAKDFVNFFVLDLAETETGEWILIEINDGQMSGLSENDPDTLYSELKICLG